MRTVPGTLEKPKYIKFRRNNMHVTAKKRSFHKYHVCQFYMFFVITSLALLLEAVVWFIIKL